MDKVLNYLDTTPEVKIAVTAILIIAVAVIIWLLLRNTRLWYWKTDKIIGAVDVIDSRISELENSIDTIRITAEKIIEETQNTHEALMDLQEKYQHTNEALLTLQEKYQITGEALMALENKSQLLLEEGRNRAKEGTLLIAENEKLTKVLEQAVEDSRAAREFTERFNMKGQVNDIESTLEELRKQKEQLEADINAKIID